MKCTRCGNAKHRGRCRKIELAEAVCEAIVPDVPEANSLTFEIPPSLGVRCTPSKDLLTLEQDRLNSEDGAIYTHRIELAPHEARQLIDRIAKVVHAEPA
jgi:hypothetical protein